MKIFVYGSLRRGFGNAFYLNGQRFFGNASSAPRYRMFDCGGFPGLVMAGEDGQGVAIEGEIWEVDAECLARIDVLEGVEDRDYRRGAIALAPGHGEHGPVSAYFWEKGTENLREVDGGVWTLEDERRNGQP